VSYRWVDDIQSCSDNVCTQTVRKQLDARRKIASVHCIINDTQHIISVKRLVE